MKSTKFTEFYQIELLTTCIYIHQKAQEKGSYGNWKSKTTTSLKLLSADKSNWEWYIEQKRALRF